jgi:hypothetical protein
MIPSLFLQFPRIEPEKAGPGAGISALGVGGDSVAGVLYLGSAYTVCSGLVGYSALPVEAFFFFFPFRIAWTTSVVSTLMHITCNILGMDIVLSYGMLSWHSLIATMRNFLIRSCT